MNKDRRQHKIKPTFGRSTPVLDFPQLKANTKNGHASNKLYEVHVDENRSQSQVWREEKNGNFSKSPEMRELMPPSSGSLGEADSAQWTVATATEMKGEMLPSQPPCIYVTKNNPSIN